MKHRILKIVVFTAALGIAHVTKSQDNNPAPCPAIRITCTDLFQPGPIACTANITGADPRLNPTYRWETSDEMTILTGQGTSTLTVTWQRVNYFLAAVKVGGLPPECASSEEYSAISDAGLFPRKVAEYGVVPFKVEKSHLDRLIAELRKDKTAQGYILSYGGRRSWENEAAWRGERARRHLIRDGGFDPRRIVAVDAGYRDERFIELYVVTSGGFPPAGSPTVDPGEVKISRRRSRSLRR